VLLARFGGPRRLTPPPNHEMLWSTFAGNHNDRPLAAQIVCLIVCSPSLHCLARLEPVRHNKPFQSTPVYLYKYHDFACLLTAYCALYAAVCCCMLYAVWFCVAVCTRCLACLACSLSIATVILFTCCQNKKHSPPNIRMHMSLAHSTPACHWAGRCLCQRS
jgi:hypothetical protein